MKHFEYSEPVFIINLYENLKKEISIDIGKSSDFELQILSQKLKSTEKMKKYEFKKLLFNQKSKFLDGLRPKLISKIYDNKLFDIWEGFERKTFSLWSSEEDLYFVFKFRFKMHSKLFEHWESDEFQKTILNLQNNQEADEFIKDAKQCIDSSIGYINLINTLLKYDRNNLFKERSFMLVLKDLFSLRIPSSELLKISENIAEEIILSGLDYSSQIFSEDQIPGFLISNFKKKGINFSSYPYLMKFLKERKKIHDSIRELREKDVGRYDYWMNHLHLSSQIRILKTYNKVFVAMKYGNWVLVEQGPAGNALYVYESNTFETIFKENNWAQKDKTYKGFNDLLNKQGTLHHRMGWQDYVDELLSRMLSGIYV